MLQRTLNTPWPSTAKYAVESINSSLSCLKFMEDDTELRKWIISMQHKYHDFDRLTTYPIQENQIVLGVWVKDQTAPSPQLVEIYRYPLDMPDMY